MQYRLARQADIEDILALQQKYHIDSIAPEDKKNGFVTTLSTAEQLAKLIDIKGLFLALDEDKLAAYAMAAPWSYWAAWPMFRYMIEGLSALEIDGVVPTIENSYQYGPACIEKEYRGRGLLKELFDFVYEEMREQIAAQTPILLTFINKVNPRSYRAHTGKCGLRVIHEFSYNGNEYYELAYTA